MVVMVRTRLKTCMLIRRATPMVVTAEIRLLEITTAVLKVARVPVEAVVETLAETP